MTLHTRVHSMASTIIIADSTLFHKSFMEKELKFVKFELAHVTSLKRSKFSVSYSSCMVVHTISQCIYLHWCLQ